MQALPSVAWAQTGKLSGIVTEAGSAMPIPGVTVLLENTTQGAVTDEQGRYSIIGISPGSYSVRFSSVGYQTKIVADIRVTSDRTTDLNAELTTEVIEGDEVIVEAERPVVDANQTTSRAIVTSDEIERLPVSNLQDVISRTANSYEGFLRGSRRFETKTILEGIDVSDAFYQLGNANYAGLTYSNTNRADETNPGLFEINPEAVEEVTVNTGATDARYSSASGGIVAIALQEGRGPIQGSFSARVAPQINRPGPDSLDFYVDSDRYLQERDALAASPSEASQRKAQLYTWTPDKYAQGDDPEMDMRFSLGGSITDKWTFFTTGQFFQTNGYMPNYFRKRLSGQLKTSYNILQNTRLTAVGLVEDRGLWGNWNNRDYHDFWRYYVEGVAQNDGGSYLGSLKLTQVLSPKSYLDVQVYRTYQRTRYGYVDDDGDGFTEVGEDGDFIDFSTKANIDKYVNAVSGGPLMFNPNISDQGSNATLTNPGGLALKVAKPVPYREDQSATTNGVRLDFASQVTFHHFIQAGAEFKARQFDYDEQYGVDGLGFTLNAINEPFIPRFYERSPTEFSLYASDRMEYRNLIVNLGLRMDVIDRDTEYINNYFYPFRRDSITTEDGRKLARNFFDRGESVPRDVFLNPTLGVSHPIGSRASMYFSYGRSQQLVPYSTLYSLYSGNHSNSQFFDLQDPAQDPITSNNYELGLQWEFAQGWGADVNAYMRNVDNYGRAGFTAVNRRPSTEPAVSNIPPNHFFITGFGYADSRGVELVLRRRPLQLANDLTLGLTASYTYATVEQAQGAGTNQTLFAASGDTVTAIPFDNAEDFRHFAWNVRGGNSVLTGGYDRRHRGVLRAVAGLPYGFSMGLTGSVESGFLYQRLIGADPRDRELLTGPLNHRVDLRLEYRLNFVRRFGLDFYVDVQNLLNRQNVVAYNSNPQSSELFIFEETGNPGSRLIQPDGSPLYGPARNVYFGSRLRF